MNFCTKYTKYMLIRDLIYLRKEKKYNEEELKKIINNDREPVFVAVDEKKIY